MGLLRRQRETLHMSDRLTRVAIVNAERCKPSRCRQECKRSCPVVLQGKLCIEVNSKAKIAWISEFLCIGCGICVKKCPFDAINIINLPKNLEKETTHRYGPNTFKLHRLPTPRTGQVLGLVGKNGIGKSTALKILAGKLKPNLGQYNVCSHRSRFSRFSDRGGGMERTDRSGSGYDRRTLLLGRRSWRTSVAQSCRTTLLA